MSIALGIVILLLFSGAILSAGCKDFDASERKIVALSLLFHLVGAQALLSYYANVDGDIHTYLIHGINVAYLLEYDFPKYFPEVLNLVFHRHNELPLQVFLEGSSTGSISGITSLAAFFVSDTPLLINALFSLFALSGQVFLYRTFRSNLSIKERLPVALGTFLVPSVVFWTSGVQKEAVLIGSFGPFVWGVARALRRRSFLGLWVGVLGGIGIGIIKAYLLLPSIIGIAAWLYVARGGERISFGYRVAAIAIALVGLFAITQLFPEYSVDNLADAMQNQRDAASRAEGGSNIAIGVDAQRTMAGQLIYAPLALINTLFRPVLFEVRNGGQLMAGLETTAIFVILGQLYWRGGLMPVWREIRRTPMLFAALLFMLSFSIGVGLATTNLGTLSRYRVPMMPAYALLLLVLRQRFAPKKVVVAKPGYKKATSTDPSAPALLSRDPRLAPLERMKVQRRK